MASRIQALQSSADTLKVRVAGSNFANNFALIAASRQSANGAARQAFAQPDEATEHSTLPVLATPGDVREVVQYLKKKPGGVSVIEAMSDVKRRVFESRKIAAFEYWGIVKRSGDRLQLTALGTEFAEKLASEATTYRAVLARCAAYQAALEWIWQQNLELVTHAQLAGFWQQQFFDSFAPNDGNKDEKMAEGNAVCFFHLCQAAQLGTATIGKRGQPARLYVELDELQNHIVESRHTSTIDTEAAEVEAKAVHLNQSYGLLNKHRSNGYNVNVNADRSQPLENGTLRVFVSQSGRTPIAEQIKTMLELVDAQHTVINFSVSEKGVPVADEVCRALRECNAGIIVLSEEDFIVHESSPNDLRDGLMREISAAFVLYDCRLIVLCDKHLTLPENLSGVRRCDLEGETLTWEGGVQLLGVLREYKCAVREQAAT